MNSIIKSLTIATFIVCALLVVGLASDAATALPADCGCDSFICQSDNCQTCQSCSKGQCGKRCGSCGKLRRSKKCPQCECDFCLLELDHGTEERTCFKTEQKLVCVPPVRMPWMKCCPPGTSKTKTVKVLKKHIYECPTCSYKWTVQEPAVAATTTTTRSEPIEAQPAGTDGSESESAEPEANPEKATPPRPPFENETPPVSVRF